jgi:hypothetical protein
MSFIVVGCVLIVAAILNIIFRRRIADFQNRYRPGALRARTTTKVIGSCIVVVIGLIAVLAGAAELAKHAAH